MIIIIPLLSVILIYLVLAIAYRLDARGYLKISFKKFYNLYCINPKKWGIHLDYCVFYDTSDDKYRFEIRFGSYFDRIRYKMFRDHLESNANNIELNKIKTKLLREWQEDIDNYRGDYMKDLKQRLREVEEEQKIILQKINNGDAL